MTVSLNIRSVQSIDEIKREDWDRLANSSDVPYDPFLSYDFFAALEHSGSVRAHTGWGPSHLVATDGTKNVVGIMPLYLKGHSQGEYVFDHGWARGFEMAGGRYYPKLLCAVPFTPVTGRRLFAVGDTAQKIKTELLKAAVKQGVSQRLSSLHVNFIEPNLVPLLEDEQFLIRSDTQFQWENQGYETFDDFLSSLQSRKRKAIKKERRLALINDLEVEWVSGDDLERKHWDAFYQFYVDTFDRKWGTPYLTHSFFELIHETLRKSIVLIFAKRGEDYIAAALNFKGSDTLYGRYWGAKEHHDFLHFELCYYQAIDYALANNLNRVEAGAQGEHKLLRGYAPQKTHSAHFILHDGLREAVKDFLIDEERFVDMRTDALKEHLPFKSTKD
ncbi:MAG: N-acetyltransferase [Rhizobiales bacterium]|nr:N-acetyltransferase [Hyphomicrobiales bacterium]